jgi:hypothetical protein
LSCADATEGADWLAGCAAVMASKYATGDRLATAQTADPHASAGMMYIGQYY